MINLLLLLTMLSAQGGSVHHVSGAHVTVFYPQNVDASVAKGYLTVLDQMYSNDSGRLQVGTRGTLRVRLCRDAYQFSNLTGADSIFSPLWKDGTLYIVVGNNLTDLDYASKLESGVIRGILNYTHSNGAPWWLICSAAIYESGEYRDCTAPPIESVRYFADLDEKIQGASSATDLADLCFYLGNTGKFFDLKFGVGALVQLMREFQHETTLNAAVKKIFHIDRAQLERSWREFLAREAREE